MRIALSEMVVEGIKTNIPLHQELLLDDEVPARRHVDPLSRGAARQAQAVRLTPACAARDVYLVAALRRRRRRRRRLVRRAARRRRAVGRRVRSRMRARRPKSPLYARARRSADALVAAVARRRAVSGRRRRRGRARRGGAARSAWRCRPHERGRGRRAGLGARTQAQFGPIRIDDGLWIVPSWCDAAGARRDQPRARSRARVRHRLASDDAAVPRSGCARRAARRRARARLRLRLGHPRDRAPRSSARGDVVGTDIDPQAIDASRANARRERRRGRRSRCPMRSTRRTCDVVVANILANPLIVLAPALAARTRAGGRIALSGILDDQADDVVGGVRALVYTRRLAHGRRLGRCSRACGTRSRPAPGVGTATDTPIMADEQYTRCPGCATDLPRDAASSSRCATARCAAGIAATVFDGKAQLISLAPPVRAEGDAGAARRARRRPADGHAAQRAGAAPRARGAPTPARAPASRAAIRGRRRSRRDDDDATAGVDYDSRFAWDRPRSRGRARCAGSTWRGIPVLLVLLVGAGAVPFPRRDRRALAADAAAADPHVRARPAARSGRCATSRALSIDASDLQADPAHKGLLILTRRCATARATRSPIPYLELTLTDANDQVGRAARAARRPSTPAAPPTSAKGIAANGEVGRASCSSTRARRRRRATACTCSTPDAPSRCVCGGADARSTSVRPARRRGRSRPRGHALHRFRPRVRHMPCYFGAPARAATRRLVSSFAPKSRDLATFYRDGMVIAKASAPLMATARVRPSPSATPPGDPA